MLPSLSLPGSGSINMVPEEKLGDYLTHESQQHSLLSLGTMVPLVVAVPTVLSDGESCLFGHISSETFCSRLSFGTG